MFGWLKRKPQKPVKDQARRSFSAAGYSRLTASLESESAHIMSILRSRGKALRARSRQVATDTSTGAKFLQMVSSNVCGPQPFKLQSKIKYASGKFDTGANVRIETEWADWGRPGRCDVEGRLSFADILRLLAVTLARDGEYLVQVAEGSQAGPWGMQLRILDVDRLDEDKNEELRNGNVVIAGVEVDPQGRTVAYHLLKRKPRDWQYGVAREYVRIDASQIIHDFLPLYAEQVRGVPWMFAAILKMHQLGAFEEAAIIAARVGASKMGLFQQKGGSEFAPEGAYTNADGNFVQTAEPGEFGFVPDGWELSNWNPQYPDSQVDPFMKAMMRGVASSLNVAAHNLSGDMSDVNYSSARIAELAEREYWMGIQAWLVEHFLAPVYERWLTNAILRRKLPFPMERADKYMAVTFQPRRWQWVDPLKETQSNIEAIKWGLKSRTQVVNESGGDIEDVFDNLKMEADLAGEKGIEIDGDASESAASMEDGNENKTDASQVGE